MGHQGHRVAPNDGPAHVGEQAKSDRTFFFYFYFLFDLPAEVAFIVLAMRLLDFTGGLPAVPNPTIQLPEVRKEIVNDEF